MLDDADIVGLNPARLPIDLDLLFAAHHPIMKNPVELELVAFG